MKILITGGVGFIGQHLARLLIAQGDEVIALDSLHNQVHLDPEGASAAFPGEVFVGDVSEASAWVNLPDVDAVVHLAAETGTGQSMYEQDRYHRVNVEGTRLAAQWAVAHQAPLMSMSSRAVYGHGGFLCEKHGMGHGEPCCDLARPVASTEGDPHLPVSVYGETKSLGETVAFDIAQGHIPLTVIRPQNVIGPGQALHNPYTGVLAAFLARLREGRPISVYGDGSQTRDFVHVQDLAALISWAIHQHDDVGEPLVLNSGTGERTTLLQLAEYAMAGSPGVQVPVEHVAVTRAGDIDHAAADLGNSRSAGAPVPQWSTAAAVADFIGWSWDKPGAQSTVWDDALTELSQRGLTQ